MPWPHAFNQTALNDFLYQLESPIPHTTACLILCHGRSLAGLPPHIGRYELPPGVTVHYWVPHGERHISSPFEDIAGSARITHREFHELLQANSPTFDGQRLRHPTLSITGPATIENYLLDKQGSSSEPHTQHYSYEVLCLMMGAVGLFENRLRPQCPHVVTLRRRSALADVNITLGAVISEVRRRQPMMREFYFNGCRDVAPRSTPGTTVRVLTSGGIIDCTQL